MYIELPVQGKGLHSIVADDTEEKTGGGLAASTDNTARDTYWRANLKLGAALLAIWFIVSFGFGILLVEPLNRIPFFGFKLGFWWAQQGSIYVFIILIFVYARAMQRLDRKYDVHDDD